MKSLAEIWVDEKTIWVDVSSACGAREVNGVEEGCDAMSCNDGQLQRRREQIYSLAAMM